MILYEEKDGQLGFMESGHEYFERINTEVENLILSGEITPEQGAEWLMQQLHNEFEDLTFHESMGYSFNGQEVVTFVGVV